MQLRKIQFYLFILVIIVNFGVQFFYADPFGDDPTVYIQPAGYAFAIWGPIFIGMILYSWFQMQSARVESPHLESATKAGILAALASITFVPISYTDMQWLGFLNIIWHLLALIWLFVSLRKQVGIEKNPNTRWFYLPTQMYLGWICAATAVSVALTLRQTFGVEFPLETELTITAAVIVALLGVGILLAANRGLISALVIVWALVALIVEFGEFVQIKYTASAAIFVLVATVLFYLFKKKRRLVF